MYIIAWNTWENFRTCYVGTRKPNKHVNSVHRATIHVATDTDSTRVTSLRDAVWRIVIRRGAHATSVVGVDVLASCSRNQTIDDDIASHSTHLSPTPPSYFKQNGFFFSWLRLLLPLFDLRLFPFVNITI